MIRYGYSTTVPPVDPEGYDYLRTGNCGGFYLYRITGESIPDTIGTVTMLPSLTCPATRLSADDVLFFKAYKVIPGTTDFVLNLLRALRDNAGISWQTFPIDTPY